jgi:hypothetical protein
MSLFTKIKSLFKTKQYCSFCKIAHYEVRKLIVGPPASNNKNHHTGICNGCTDQLVHFLKEKDIKKIDNIKKFIDKMIHCNFCGKNFDKPKQMFSTMETKTHPYICNKCVKLCEALVKDN